MKLILGNDGIYLASFLRFKSTFLGLIFIIELNAIPLRAAPLLISIELYVEEIFLCFQEFITHDDSSRSESNFLIIFAFNRLDRVRDP
jgi:hypothetical protein